MPIEILPAQLANQIAAGEVVERPASVIKELVENSLDAGATTIKIHVEKGGAKRIKISDNGSGIAKDELALALSRHATSKIKTLNDLEGISSLGFRGEALASISSVARLTLTSKPAGQEAAWQASAEGRDMEVDIKPAAHPNGTTIDVQDLFFNTPARRKFLRTDKTEFSHIEEVIKRIALACLDVTFVLVHNDKLVRQYRAATTKPQFAKRVAQICGQKFIDHAIEIECQHDELHFSGWLAKPSFARNQNDLCYSYVNGRMMRDKLINHAIRQAYSDLLPPDTYPAFVLFLTVNYRDVDVNVHPAKHEVRFHQGRYIHDFIFSVCQKALMDANELFNEEEYQQIPSVTSTDESGIANHERQSHITHSQNNYQPSSEHHPHNEPSYIKPLSYVNEASAPQYTPSYQKERVSNAGKDAYYQLMSNEQATDNDEVPTHHETRNNVIGNATFFHIVQQQFMLILVKDTLRLLSLAKLETALFTQELQEKWENGFVSQPLLLPVKINVVQEQIDFITQNTALIEQLGIVLTVVNNSAVQIRQFPALLRNKDVSHSFLNLLTTLIECNKEKTISALDGLMAFTSLLIEETYSEAIVEILQTRLKKLQPNTIDEILLLNSCPVDLTSEIHQLM